MKRQPDDHDDWREIEWWYEQMAVRLKEENESNRRSMEELKSRGGY